MILFRMGVYRGSKRTLRAPFSFLILLAAITACGWGREASDSPPSDATAVAPASDPGQEPAASGRTPVQLPGAGKFWVAVSERGVSAGANKASLVLLLEELGRQLEFEVDVRQPFRRRWVTLQASDEPVEVVMARALAGSPYSLRYEADERGERTALAAVEVRRARAPGTTERGLARGASERRLARLEARQRRRDAASPEDREKRREGRRRVAEQHRARRAESGPNPRESGPRGLLANEPDSFERISGLLRNDPDPAVRIAAAELIFDSDSAAALGELLAALDDPNPEVVLASIDLLEYEGDETLIPAVERLADHPDPRVREAVAEFKDFVGR